MKQKLTIILLLISFVIKTNAQIELLSDFNNVITNENLQSSTPNNFIDFNGIIYFSAKDTLHGRELWRTDGTNAGTWMVCDLIANASSNPSNFIIFNNELYFTSSETHCLYKTDGTSNGTSVVYNASGINNLTIANGKLFFTASYGIYGNELFATDGSTSGTYLVKDIFPGNSSSFPSYLKEINGILYFSAMGSSNNLEVWKSDGTANGTVLVKDLNSSSSSYPYGYTYYNGYIYFGALVSSTGRELYRTDGTTAGTSLFKDIYSGSGSSNPNNLTVLNGSLFFFASDGTNGKELWKTDGTVAGTFMLKDIWPGSLSSINNLKVVLYNNLLFFTANDSLHGEEIWITDGTSNGTVLFKDIAPPGGNASISNFCIANSLLYFTANDSIHGGELWVSDGTPANTHMVTDINNLQSSSISQNGSQLFSSSDTVFFGANDGIHGNELWKSDGNTSVLIKDISSTNGSTSQALFGFINDTILLYRAFDVNYGQELFIGNGTDTNSTILKDISPGPASSNPYSVATVGDKQYFTVTDSLYNTTLWVTDGTSLGTNELIDVYNDPYFDEFYFAMFYNECTSIGDTLFFPVIVPNSGRVLWRTDGTTAGTYPISNLFPDPNGFGILNMCTLGNKVLFTGKTDTTGYELFITDGTMAGTQLVKDIYAGTNGSQPSHYNYFNNNIYFTAYDDIHGTELWKTDGTTSGTELLSDNYVGTGSSLLTCSQELEFGALDSVFLYSSRNDTSGYELWRSNGSTSGTYLFYDLYTYGSFIDLWCLSCSFPKDFIRNGNNLFFSADIDNYGRELVKSDGTIGGTGLVMDTSQLTGTSFDPSDFFIIQNNLYFLADDGIHGREFWVTDGTQGGTFMCGETEPGLEDKNIIIRGVNSTTCYFLAQDANTGYELYRFDPLFVKIVSVNNLSFQYGQKISIVFDAVGTYPSGNIFIAQMSDSTGNFDNPFFLSSITKSVSDTISVCIPTTIGPGTGYKVRVISTTPDAYYGISNGNITIQQSTNAAVFDTLYSNICVNENAFLLTGGIPSGGIYSGYGVSSNYFDPGFAGVGSHEIIYTINTAEGCELSDTNLVFVHSLPQVSLNNLLPICENSIPIIIDGGQPSGGIYSGSGMNGNQFSPDIAGSGIHEIYYSYTDTNGCESVDTAMIAVYPVPSVTIIDLNNNYCLNDPSDTILGNPPGGAFSGPGMNLNVFQPSVADTGIHVIYYAYQDLNGCIGIDSVTTIVDVCNSINYMPFDLCSFFPNPADNLVMLNFSRQTNGKINLLNAMGISVLNREISDSELLIDVSFMPSGLYFFKIEFDNKTIYRKIIIE